MDFMVDARFVPNADYQAYLEDEKRHVAMLREQGRITSLFQRSDGTGAFLTYSAASEDEARQQLEELPFVQRELMTLTLWPVLVL